MLEICTLASGSKGNAHLIGASGSYVLVDCGISALRIRNALDRIGVSLSAVEGILITHEHRDHVTGLRVFRKHCPVPVYTTRGTWGALPVAAGPGSFRVVDRERPFAVGPFRVRPFTVSHDAAEPVGFAFESEWGKAVIATDLGRVDRILRENLAGARVLLLESNHDEELLQNGSYPWFLKERILSEAGHLSNRASQSALVSAAHPMLEAVILAHLSEENNRPDLAGEGAREALLRNGRDGVKIAVAEQYAESEVFTFK